MSQKQNKGQEKTVATLRIDFSELKKDVEKTNDLLKSIGFGLD